MLFERAMLSIKNKEEEMGRSEEICEHKLIVLTNENTLLIMLLQGKALLQIKQMGERERERD